MNRDMFSDSKPVNAIAAETTLDSDTTTYGAWIDTQFYNSLVIPIDVDWTTDGQIDSIGFQGSDIAAHTDAADLDDALNLYSPEDFPIVADALVHVGCIAKTRYVRLKIVTTGFTSGSIVIPKTAGFLQSAMRKPNSVSSSVIANDDIVSQGDTGDASSTFPKRPVS